MVKQEIAASLFTKENFWQLTEERWGGRYVPVDRTPPWCLHRAKVRVICPIHGEISILTKTLMSGTVGCVDCADEARNLIRNAAKNKKTREKGRKASYSLSNYNYSSLEEVLALSSKRQIVSSRHCNEVVFTSLETVVSTSFYKFTTALAAKFINEDEEIRILDRLRFGRFSNVPVSRRSKYYGAYLKLRSEQMGIALESNLEDPTHRAVINAKSGEDFVVLV